MTLAHRTLVLLAAVPAALLAQNRTDRPFVSGGKIELQLDGGSYTIRPATDNHIRVSLEGNIGNAKADVNVNGTNANVAVRDTPHNKFRATIELPKMADLVLRLKAGELDMAAITGNKDIDSGAGDVRIAVGNPNDYASVDASVKVGDLNAPAFGQSKGGFAPHITWSGHGKYTLKANLGAGDLRLE
jgi:hypothetical protein